MAATANIDMKSLKSRNPRYQAKEAVALRKAFSIRGRSLEFTVIELGIALNRDHSVISYHANGKTKKRSPWKARTPEQKQQANLAAQGRRRMRREARYSKRVVHDLAMNL